MSGLSSWNYCGLTSAQILPLIASGIGVILHQFLVNLTGRNVLLPFHRRAMLPLAWYMHVTSGLYVDAHKNLKFYALPHALLSFNYMYRTYPLGTVAFTQSQGQKKFYCFQRINTHSSSWSTGLLTTTIVELRLLIQLNLGWCCRKDGSLHIARHFYALFTSTFATFRVFGSWLSHTV